MYNKIFKKCSCKSIKIRGHVPTSTNDLLLTVLCEPKKYTLCSFFQFLAAPIRGEKYNKRSTWHLHNKYRLSKLTNKEIVCWLQHLKKHTTLDLFFSLCQHVVEIILDTSFYPVNFRDLTFLLLHDEFCVPTWMAICKWGHTEQRSKVYYTHLFKHGVRFTTFALDTMFVQPTIQLFILFAKKFFKENRSIARVFLKHMIAGRHNDFVDMYFFSRQSFDNFDFRDIPLINYKTARVSPMFHELIVGFVTCTTSIVKLGEKTTNEVVTKSKLHIKSTCSRYLLYLMNKLSRGRNNYCKILFIFKCSAHNSPEKHLFDVMETDMLHLGNSTIKNNPMGIFEKNVKYTVINKLEELEYIYNLPLNKGVVDLITQRHNSDVCVYKNDIKCAVKKIRCFPWIPSNAIVRFFEKNDCVLPYNLNDCLNLSHNRNWISFTKHHFTILEIQTILQVFTHINSFWEQTN